jgi:tetratricopeptide (TPR) repeat protein
LLYLEIVINTDILSLKELVYLAIGFFNAELGNYMKAIEAYKQAISIDPDYANTYYSLGRVYALLGSL